jgi:hypothetical protein
MVKQEDEINSDNGFAVFEIPSPRRNSEDDTENNTGNTWKNITVVQCTV